MEEKAAQDKDEEEAGRLELGEKDRSGQPAAPPSGWFSTCASGGCGAKIGSADLAALVANLPRLSDPRLLAGYDGAEDAGVYLGSGGEAIVSTADFFPPMVSDPLLFGRAAAANALSDVYAMGGRPLMALNLVCFPQGLSQETLGLILLGGAEKVMEAGAVIAGGHSIYDHEPKYGLAVTGVVDPKRMWRNQGASPGDAVLLTKALGVGLILGARRVSMASDFEFEGAAASISRLNRYAAEALSDFEVAAATDVTGFGLAGHLAEMAGDNLTCELDYEFLPVLPGAERLAEEFLATGGGQRNRVQLSGSVDLGDIGAAREEIIYDPQTSGGLAVCLGPGIATKALEAVRRLDPAAAIVGVMSKRAGRCKVRVY
ncbi:MAG: selenide, water dikinase SelD [Deltaproteobacteria bacterium]|nr:selenide, water dikinase SelD [Deltaproteobacteria bacterium]